MPLVFIHAVGCIYLENHNRRINIVEIPAEIISHDCAPFSNEWTQVALMLQFSDWPTGVGEKPPVHHGDFWAMPV